MNDLATSVALLLGVSVVLYFILTVVFTRITTRTYLLAAAGLVPLLVWVIAPYAVSAGDLGVSLAVRRPALLLMAGAVGLRYVAIRTDRSDRIRSVAGTSSAGLFWLGAAIAASNWIVALGALVSAAAFVRARPRTRDEVTSAASAGVVRRRSADPPTGQ